MVHKAQLRARGPLLWGYPFDTGLVLYSVKPWKFRAGGDSFKEFARRIYSTWISLFAASPFILLGVLSGFGVPVSTWVWIVATNLSLLFAFFLVFHKERVEAHAAKGALAEHVSRRKVAEQLAAYLDSGNNVLFRIQLAPILEGMSEHQRGNKGLSSVTKTLGGQSKAQLDYREALDKWSRGVRLFLETNLGKDYVVRFNTKLPNLSVDLSEYGAIERPWASLVIHHQARLEQFMEELRR